VAVANGLVFAAALALRAMASRNATAVG